MGHGVMRYIFCGVPHASLLHVGREIIGDKD